MIVGIVGLAGSGKDTAADVLVQQRGGLEKVAFADPLKRAARDIFDFTVDQLWGPSAMRNAPDERYPREHTWHQIKAGFVEHGASRYACKCCGSTAETVSELDAKQCYLTPRYALQQLGTEYGRHCYQNVWVDHLLRTAKQISTGRYEYTNVSGLEYKGVLTSRTSVVVPDVRFANEVDALVKAGAKLVRITRSSSGLDGAAGTHVSETEQAEMPDERFDAIIMNDGSLDDLKVNILQAVR